MKNPLKKAREVVKDVKRSVAAKGRDSGESGTPLGERTKEQLYNRARELDVAGRSKMNKGQLVAAIRRAQ